MHPDHRSYLRFTTHSRLEKSINSLLGIIEGISIDGHINPTEKGFLDVWLQEHQELQGRHPYNELMPVVGAAIEDGVLTTDERQDIIWLCERMRSTDFFDQVTADLQRLHAITGGIASDGRILEAELRGLSDWLAQHEHLRTCWPYDEVCSVVTSVLADGRMDAAEHDFLQKFFAEFVAVLDDRVITNPTIDPTVSLVGLCSVCPEIRFAGTTFCFTGASSRLTRVQFIELVERLGGRAVQSVTRNVDYLVIGAEGNPCWAYACYGRKVEAAVKLRKAGARIVLVHEHDFHDAVADSGS